MGLGQARGIDCAKAGSGGCRKWWFHLGESIIFAWAAVRGAPGCRRAVREGFRSSCWALRRSFWMSREFILDSSKVIFEFPRVIFAT